MDPHRNRFHLTRPACISSYSFKWFAVRAYVLSSNQVLVTWRHVSIGLRLISLTEELQTKMDPRRTMPHITLYQVSSKYGTHDTVHIYSFRLYDLNFCSLKLHFRRVTFTRLYQDRIISFSNSSGPFSFLSTDALYDAVRIKLGYDWRRRGMRCSPPQHPPLVTVLFIVTCLVWRNASCLHMSKWTVNSQRADKDIG